MFFVFPSVRGCSCGTLDGVRCWLSYPCRCLLLFKLGLVYFGLNSTLPYKYPQNNFGGGWTYFGSNKSRGAHKEHKIIVFFFPLTSVCNFMLSSTIVIIYKTMIGLISLVMGLWGYGWFLIVGFIWLFWLCNYIILVCLFNHVLYYFTV